MLRFHTTDDAGRPAKVRWWRGFSLGGWRWALSLWRPLLPIIAVCALPTGLATLAYFNGPFVVALVLFSPFASLLLVSTLSLLLFATGAAGKVVQRTVQLLRTVGECPACGYLQGLDLDEPARAAPCPECGTTWAFGQPSPPQRIVVRAPMPPRAPTEQISES